MNYREKIFGSEYIKEDDIIDMLQEVIDEYDAKISISYTISDETFMGLVDLTDDIERLEKLYSNVFNSKYKYFKKCIRISIRIDKKQYSENFISDIKFCLIRTPELILHEHPDKYGCIIYSKATILTEENKEKIKESWTLIQ